MLVEGTNTQHRVTTAPGTYLQAGNTNIRTKNEVTKINPSRNHDNRSRKGKVPVGD